mmetsp:Transcript_6846/g.10893  ORF Transcript_6846/g.10893 Transcript_6846/m.10893 type:complete len:83 (-) Transcript_6846:81-329(-)
MTMPKIEMIPYWITPSKQAINNIERCKEFMGSPTFTLHDRYNVGFALGGSNCDSSSLVVIGVAMASCVCKGLKRAMLLLLLL